MQLEIYESLGELIAPDVFYVYAHNSNGSGFRYVSRNIERFAGKPAREILSAPGSFFEAISSGFREFLQKLLTHEGGHQILRDKIAVPWEKGNDQLWTEVSGAQTRDETTGELITRGIIRDATPLMKSSEFASRLETVKRYTSKIIDSMTDAVLLIGPDGRVIASNTASDIIFGAWTRNRSLGEILQDKTIQYEILDQSGWIERKLFMPDSGKTLFLRGHPIPGADGQLLAISIQARDITEAEAKDKRLRGLNEAIQNSSDGIMLATLDGKVIYVNPAAARLYGSTEEELKERPILDSLVSDQVVLPQYAEIRDTVSQGKPWSGRITYTCKSDGRRVVTDMSISPFVFDEGEVVCSCVVRDMTQQIELEERLNRAYRLEALGVLAGGIAHDFNNILGGIIGFAEFAKAKCDPSSDIGQFMQEIMAAGNRGKLLVNQILAFARQRTGEKQSIDVGIIAKEVLKLITPSTPASIEIRRKIMPGAGCVLIDPTQLHQVIVNLCTNAVFAMREKGGALYLGVDKVVDGGLEYVTLTVTDTGPGIPSGVLSRIFDPFFTTKREGSGVGLSVVKDIVEDCGGKIEASSVVGKGSSFRVLLPRQNQTEQSAAYETRTAQHLKHPVNIIFVDDESALVQSYGKILEQMVSGRVLATTTCREALQAFREDPEQYGLIITDYTMPEMNGDQLIERLWAVKHIPAIITTGFSQDMAGLQKLAQRGIEILQKPLLINEMSVAIKRAMKSHEGKKKEERL